jgi:hypothetical protein
VLDDRATVAGLAARLARQPGPELLENRGGIGMAPRSWELLINFKTIVAVWLHQWGHLTYSSNGRKLQPQPPQPRSQLLTLEVQASLHPTPIANTQVLPWSQGECNRIRVRAYILEERRAA